ncbi:MAG: hypothetical protein UE068_04465, partial [Paludibacteraceae bacterium]|nr:hypothetical protein [Paludibacteraceae bacterium]
QVSEVFEVICSFPDCFLLCGRQSVTVVRGRYVTFGDGKIINPPSSTIHHQSSTLTIINKKNLMSQTSGFLFE